MQVVWICRESLSQCNSAQFNSDQRGEVSDYRGVQDEGSPHNANVVLKFQSVRGCLAGLLIMLGI